MEKRVYMAIGLLIVIVLMAGCLSGEPGQKTAASPEINITNYPRVDGSTSTHPLAVIIACKFMNVSYTWLNGSGDNPMLDVFERDVYPAYKPESAAACEFISGHVNRTGTHGAYVNLIENSTDLILVARPPSQDEQALATNRNVRLTVKPVALDAFVFLVNRNNTVDSLTVDQVRAIYRGETTDWSRLGGNASRINAYHREANSGSEELMQALVMHGETMDTPSDMVLYTMMAPIYQLSRDEAGICYSVYYFKEFMSYGQNVKMCAVDGVYPDYANISSRRYPLTAEVYVVVREDLDKDSSAYKMYEWLLGDEGQAVVRESGYVPMAGP